MSARKIFYVDGRGKQINILEEISVIGGKDFNRAFKNALLDTVN